MSDPEDPQLDEPGFDDPQYDELRALLAEAKVTEPVPAEVAARLDATLGSLRDQRRVDAARPDGSVLVMRRRVARLLVAAAVVAVVGAAGATIVRQSGNGSTSADSAASGTAAENSQAQPQAPTPATAEQRAPKTMSLAGAPVLSMATFGRDAARYMRSVAAGDVSGTTADNLSGSGSAASPGPSGTSDTNGTNGTNGTQDSLGALAPSAPPVVATPQLPATGYRPEAASCAGPTISGAVTVPATLDGRSVALVFLAPTTTGQRVQAWSCDGATLLASADVPH